MTLPSEPCTRSLITPCITLVKVQLAWSSLVKAQPRRCPSPRRRSNRCRTFDTLNSKSYIGSLPSFFLSRSMHRLAIWFDRELYHTRRRGSDDSDTATHIPPSSIFCSLKVLFLSSGSSVRNSRSFDQDLRLWTLEAARSSVPSRIPSRSPLRAKTRGKGRASGGWSRSRKRARASPGDFGRGEPARSSLPFPFAAVYRYVRYSAAPAPAAPTCCCPARAAPTHWRHAVSNNRPPATDNSTCLWGVSPWCLPDVGAYTPKHASTRPFAVPPALIGDTIDLVLCWTGVSSLVRGRKILGSR